MEKIAKRIDEKDNVMIALADFEAGERITTRFRGDETTYTINQSVPFGHKIAITDIPRGEKVVKYGESIGSATSDIKKGDWVHVHNVKDDYKVLDGDGNPLPGQAG